MTDLLSPNSAPTLNPIASRGSAVKEQERRIVAALRLRPMTTDDFRKIGIFQISARIWGLRAQQYAITTDRITVVDRDGYAHPRAALYTLVSEPDGGVKC
ncbi:helix-turn-helix domain-containing protein [Variovorax sp. YR752]|uniref:helix-turn-helix domain-containing protein n=1 Tax=Variovorax sp. YR752 TaxID=1884383 RepID=UPI003137BD5A